MPNFSLTYYSTTSASIKNVMETLGREFFDTKGEKFDEAFVRNSYGALQIDPDELRTYIEIQINVKKRING